MGKLITWLVALIVLGAAVWFLFLRDATDKAASGENPERGRAEKCPRQGVPPL